MHEVILWHDPTSLESQRALRLLRERGHEPTIVDLTVAGPDEAAIAAMLGRLRAVAGGPELVPARALLREARAGELDGADEARILAAVARRPELLRRPVVARGDAAVVARPAEVALMLFMPALPEERPPGLPFGLDLDEVRAAAARYRG